jgi:hypothetical protein
MRLFRWIRTFVAISTITVLVSALGYVSITNANPENQAFSATIQPLGGVVERQVQGGAWQNVSKVTLLKAGDKVRTGASGTAVVSTVTGIKVSVFPTTEIELQTLSMNTGNNTGQNFSLNQLVGTTYVTVDQKVKSEDNIQFFTPSGRSIIRGTRFYIFVSVAGRTTIIGEENVVSVTDFLKQNFDNGADQMTMIDLGDLGTNAVCTVDLLTKTGKGHLVKAIDNDADRKAVFDFLKDFLKSDVTDAKVKYIAGLLGLPDTSTQEDLLAALD